MSAHTQLNMREFEGATVAGHYRLEKFLDEGAFGAVFRAAHIAYGMELREVAIKIAKRPMTDMEARRTFGDALMMARVADATPDASLREHFVAVHDAGRLPEGEPLGGHPYVVMELVRGGSLAQALNAGPFPLERAVKYFDQILRAVSFMHSAGNEGTRKPPVAHRDLKPSNILLLRREGGAPALLKVTDFGLAVEVDTLLGWVESGGDLAYLAPESFSHNVCSPQSDVYMLGLVFYEMLAGRNPFAEVGRHLRGTDEEKREELSRLHLDARHMEEFKVLDRHEEIKNQPRRRDVIRNALRPDMDSRPYRNACELKAAWDGVIITEPPAEKPWEAVRRMTGEAEQCFAVGSNERGEELLREALNLNRDPARVPDKMLSGRCYLVAVKRLIACGHSAEAGTLANEGYVRRKCRSTHLAMARYYEAEGSPLAAHMESKAAACADTE